MQDLLVEWGRPRARSENISTRINKRRPGKGILNRRLWDRFLAVVRENEPALIPPKERHEKNLIINKFPTHFLPPHKRLLTRLNV